MGKGFNFNEKRDFMDQLWKSYEKGGEKGVSLLIIL